MTVNDIIHMIFNHIFMGIRWGIIFLSFFGGLIYVIKKLFPTLLKDVIKD